MRPFVSLRLIFLLLLLSVNSAWAAFGEFSRESANSPISARLMTVSDGVNGATLISAGLQVEVEEGWKTYWRQPGVAGAGPQVDWQGSTNLADVSWSWPAPGRYEQFGIETYGYQQSVLYPLTIGVVDPGRPLELIGSAQILACKEVCIRADIPLSLSLPAEGAPVDPSAAQLVQRALSQVPVDAEQAGLSLESLGWDASRSRLQVRLSGEIQVINDLFIEGPESVFFSAPVLSREQGEWIAHLQASDAYDVPAVLAAGTQLRITLTTPDGGVELAGRIQPAALNDALPSWVMMLALAIVGGLILNAMPCVLPVLSMKLLSVAKAQTMHARQVRWNFLASATGIFVAFMFLAGSLILFKQSGARLGWGLQFQSPLFLVLMSLLMLLFALSLLGKFSFRLPLSLSDRLSNSHLGHFWQGTLAVLLATPCSAPFLGTAIAFALGGSPWHILLIMGGTAFGLALPYLVIAFAPGCLRLLPKPGRWMLTLQRVLAVLLLFTLVWLLWLLQYHLSRVGLGLFALLLAVIFALSSMHAAIRIRRVAMVLTVGLSLTLPFVAPNQLPVNSEPFSVGVIDWQPFEPERIPALVAEGKTVVVDITADWCVTCLVNKQTVLNSAEVAATLNGDQVVAMQGDWTRADPQIEQFLRRQGRYAIPFNLVIGPARPGGQLMGELLTTQSMLSAIERASASQIDK